MTTPTPAGWPTVEAVEAMAQAALDEVARMVQEQWAGRLPFRFSIPVDEQRDSDCIIVNAILALKASLAAAQARGREEVPVEAVRAFHVAFGVDLSNSWTNGDRRLLRMRLIGEEYEEYLAAERADDAAGTLDALVDLVYVIVGAALEYGMDFAGAFAAVHAANMAKLGPDGKPIVRADGKVLKPEGWKPADLTPFLPAALRARRESANG